MIKEIYINTQYVSEDTTFEVNPGSVVDKTIAGCGLTTFILNSQKDLILAEPTIALVDNKLSQGISGKKLLRYTDPKVLSGKATQGIKEGCCKILTTFDSIPKLESYLQKGWWIVIDEFQNLLTKYQLKGDVYQRVLNLLEKYQSQVTFLSATAIPEEYEPDWMKNLVHYKLRFNSEFVETVRPIMMKSEDPAKRFNRDIVQPILEKGKVNISGITFSKCIVFVNSLRAILQMVKDLPEDRFSVMCADNDERVKYLKKYKMRRFVQSKESIKHLPDFLFVTSTGFEGLDLYSKEHLNVVVSFPNNKETYSLLSMDVDIPQVLARNRSLDNPFRNRFLFIYNNSLIDGALTEGLKDIAYYRQVVEEDKEAITSLKNPDMIENCQLSSEVLGPVSLFKKDLEGHFQPNYLGLDYSEYTIKNVVKKYLNGEFQVLVKGGCYVVPEISWKSIRDKFVRVISGQLSPVDQTLLVQTGKVWFQEEQDSVYFKTLQRLQQEGKPLPEELPSKEIRRTVKKAKSDYYPQVARELKSTIALGGRYTNSELRAKIYDAYQKFGINKKVYGTTIQIYAEVTRQSGNWDARGTLMFKIKSWKE